MPNHVASEVRDPGAHWAVPAFLEYVQPPLTSEAVAAAEALLGVRLPAAYLALLGHQNGGYVRGANGVADRVFGIGPGYPSITLDRAWWRPKNAGADTWAPEGAALLIPFDGDGHWDMCLDYRAVGPEGEPSVTFVDVEAEREEPVAVDFAAYLEGLVDEALDAAIRVRGDVTAEHVARRIAERLRAPAPIADTFSHGYETWRIAVPIGKAEWCWCTPNRVPRGFRRDAATAVVTAETALRLPDEPDCAVLVSTTEDAAAFVTVALASLGLSRP